jgi:hypothetical protein
MEAVTLLMFVGVVWVLGAIGLFSWNILNRGHEHADRLALLPLEDNWTDAVANAAQKSGDNARKQQS